jgi:hypothetical protein
MSYLHFCTVLELGEIWTKLVHLLIIQKYYYNCFWLVDWVNECNLYIHGVPYTPTLAFTNIIIQDVQRCSKHGWWRLVFPSGCTSSLKLSHYAFILGNLEAMIIQNSLHFISWLDLLFNTLFLCFGHCAYGECIGIPVGTNCVVCLVKI